MASSSQGPVTRFRIHRFGAAPVDYSQAGSRCTYRDGESESSSLHRHIFSPINVAITLLISYSCFFLVVGFTF